ncbi:NAD(P)H-binding protein [Amycolatopsis benzoatilytica]|uniref:NAD(P)H-binding protein n=1 Tax=Amycolatopsis benzoatilytica TaxID=346045 RepID=UPI0003672278|nr:NAD(P)H-binding protein [Amycolatopsis benzoatilytica]
MTILVTGARGSIGSEVVRALRAGGHEVRGSARDASMLDLPDAVSLDLTAESGFEDALEGIDAIFLYPTARAGAGHFLAAAKKSGVSYVVLLSSPDVREGAAGNPLRQAHLPSERAVRESGLPFTVVYPGWLAGNTRRDWGAAIRAGDPVRLFSPDAQFAPTAEADVAAVAATLLAERSYPGSDLALTGPESMTQRAVVAVLVEELGRSIEVRPETRGEALARRPEWMPAAVLEYLMDAEEAAEKRIAPVNNTVERFTGRPATSFREWARTHRSDFEKAATVHIG